MSFGREAVDNMGVTGEFPLSLDDHRAPGQRNGVEAGGLPSPPGAPGPDGAGIPHRPGTCQRPKLTDMQTAALGANDNGWTTRGVPEGRAGGQQTYESKHLRFRDYLADMRVTVALRLEPEIRAPGIEELAQALREPQRPLFLGRKPPALHAAVRRLPGEQDDPGGPHPLAPGDGGESPGRCETLLARRRGRRPGVRGHPRP